MEEAGRAHGDIVRAIRTAQQRVQQDVADASGLKAPYVCLIETERRRPSAAISKRLALGLGVDVAVLSGQLPVLNTIRTILGIPDAAFAESVGITTAQLRRIEVGVDTPEPALVAAMARRLGVDPAVLTHPRRAPDESVADRAS
jgi:transcriptional regulator with XRE-family HTH domain